MRRASSPSGEKTRKNFRLQQAKIDRARKLLGAKTDTETVEMALDLVTFRDELVKGVRAMRGTRLTRVLDDED